jgi:A/G-specific adenine glycosylase
MLIAIDGEGAVLLEQRAASGVWGGLWSFPELAGAEHAAEWIARRLGCAARAVEEWPSLRHSFTHFHLDIVPVLARLAAQPARVMEGARFLWYKEPGPAQVGLAAPVRELLARVERTGPWRKW